MTADSRRIVAEVGDRLPGSDAAALLDSVFSVFVDTRLYLAIIAAMEVLVVSILLDYPLTIAPIIFALLTFSVYLNDQLVDFEKGSLDSERVSQYIERHRGELYVFGAVSYGLALSLSVIGGPWAFLITLVPGAAWIVYASSAMGTITETVGTGFSAVQDLFLLNTTLVALAWAGTLTVLPLTFVNETVTTRHVLVFTYFFLRVWVNTETSNIPDVDADRADGISTLPTVLGVERTRHVLYVLDIATIGLLVLAVELDVLSGLFALVLAVGAVYSSIVVAFARRYQRPGLTQVAEYEFAVVFLVLACLTVLRGRSLDFFTGNLASATAGIVLIVAIGLGASAALIAWQERPEPGALPLVAVLTGQVWWAVTLFLEFQVDSLGAMLFFSNVGWIGVVTIPVGWVVFALEYTGRNRWIQPRYLLGLLVVPLLTVFLALTSPYNTLLYRGVTVAQVSDVVYLVRSPGPWFWVVTGYTYLAGGIGVVLLLRLAWSDTLSSRRQGLALVVGTLVPWMTNVLFVTGQIPVEGLDPTPLAFAITGVAYLSAMTRFELLGSSPTPSRGAPEVAFERMDLAAVVVDRNDFVVEANRAAAELFDADSEELLGQTADEVVPGCASLLEEDAIDRQSTVEIGDEAFEVVVTPVTDPFGRTVSWIVTLSEISSYLRRQQRLEVINRTFRHDVKTKLQLLAGAAGIDDGPSDGRLETDLIEVIREIDDLSRKVRDIITIFELERESRSLPLSTVVRARVEESNREFPAANVSLSTRDEIDGVYVDEVARYVVDNVLENAIEHNDGPNPEASVTVTVDDGWATVTVADDGPGIDDTQLAVLRERRETDVSHLNGLGLWLAVWGVDMLDGEISFEENSPTGTVVTMRFPVRREATGSDTVETDPHAGDS